MSGKLEAIRHTDRAFELILTSGQRVRGIMTGEGDAKHMADLFGHHVLVHGIAKYRPSRAPRLVEAEAIERVVGDASVWSRFPSSPGGELATSEPPRPQGQRSGVAAILGKWPGDETDDEIDALLEELS